MPACSQGKLQIDAGGMCIAPGEDTLLVADCANNRVQELRIADGAGIREFGSGLLQQPQCLHCNDRLVAVAEYSSRVLLLALADGAPVAEISSWAGDEVGPVRVRVRVCLCVLVHACAFLCMLVCACVCLCARARVLSVCMSCVPVGRLIFALKNTPSLLGVHFSKSVVQHCAAVVHAPRRPTARRRQRSDCL